MIFNSDITLESMSRLDQQLYRSSLRNSADADLGKSHQAKCNVSNIGMLVLRICLGHDALFGFRQQERDILANLES